MTTFNSMLADLAARPGVYVGKVSLRDVSNLLSGYCIALMDAGQPNPLEGWFRWVEMKFLISHPAWHWTRILVHVYGSDRAALNALPGLYAEFRAFVTERGVDFIDAEHNRRFVAAYGNDYHKPDPSEASCVFCQIANGKLMSDAVALFGEDTTVFPARHQQPRNRGHMLVVPTRHVAHIYEIDNDLAGPLMTTLARVAAAVKAVNSADGVSIRQNNEPHGGQDVFHVHFHVIPRFEDDGFATGAEHFPLGAVEVPLEERMEQAKNLRDAMSFPT
jgi:histidine triad (HIT) family protein